MHQPKSIAEYHNESFINFFVSHVWFYPRSLGHPASSSGPCMQFEAGFFLVWFGFGFGFLAFRGQGVVWLDLGQVVEVVVVIVVSWF